MRAYAATIGSRTYQLTVRVSASGMRADLEGTTHTMVLVPWLGATHFHLTVDGVSTPVVVRRQGDVVFVTLGVDRFPVRVAPDLPVARRPGAAAALSRTVQVVAPMPGLVVALEVQPGSGVEQGRTVAVMEAMKMQMEIRAPAAGRVRAVHVTPGQDVAGGVPLVTIETRGSSRVPG